jgi:putative FmdB family regulatory protein
MPLFSYICKACDHSFEALGRVEETPACPSCGDDGAARQFARIARPAAGGDAGDGCTAMSGGDPCPACPAFAGDM